MSRHFRWASPRGPTERLWLRKLRLNIVTALEVLCSEGNVTVMVSEMNSAIQFYVEKLGLTLKVRYSDQFAQVVAPGLTIALHPADRQGRRSGKSEGLSIGLRVDNLERTMKDLERKGLKFSPLVEDGPVRLASFKDPDGNPLYLAESRW